MKIYQVGGCVRDRLLGIEPKDIDYVVVGGTPEIMERDLGFSKVGAAFPVFLHPVSGCEYALARKERKTGVGYNGFDVVFDPSVTLEEDLFRRDLTINAMAQDMADGTIIDPFGGRQDLENKLLRHVSDAFAEDPIRVLRTARFAARYGFTVHPDTMTLMGKIVDELNSVSQERIWAEFEKGLLENSPVRMFQVLHQCGALSCKALKVYSGADEDMLAAISEKTPLDVRFTAAASAFTPHDYEKHCIPTHCSRTAKAFNGVIDMLWCYDKYDAVTRIGILNQLRAFSSPDLIHSVLATLMLAERKWISAPVICKIVLSDLKKASSVDTELVAKSSPKNEIKQRVIDARAAAL